MHGPFLSRRWFTEVSYIFAPGLVICAAKLFWCSRAEMSLKLFTIKTKKTLEYAF